MIRKLHLRLKLSDGYAYYEVRPPRARNWSSLMEEATMALFELMFRQFACFHTECYAIMTSDDPGGKRLRFEYFGPELWDVWFDPAQPPIRVFLCDEGVVRATGDDIPSTFFIHLERKES